MSSPTDDEIHSLSEWHSHFLELASQAIDGLQRYNQGVVRQWEEESQSGHRVYLDAMLRLESAFDGLPDEVLGTLQALHKDPRLMSYPKAAHALYARLANMQDMIVGNAETPVGKRQEMPLFMVFPLLAGLKVAFERISKHFG